MPAPYLLYCFSYIAKALNDLAELKYVWPLPCHPFGVHTRTQPRRIAWTPFDIHVHMCVRERERRLV